MAETHSTYGPRGPCSHRREDDADAPISATAEFVRTAGDLSCPHHNSLLFSKLLPKAALWLG
jgi:hypothetical protein